MVSPDELETLVHRHGWRLEWHKRYQTRYAYAVKGSRKNRQKQYLCGEHSLPNLSAAEIQEIESKLQ